MARKGKIKEFKGTYPELLEGKSTKDLKAFIQFQKVLEKEVERALMEQIDTFRKEIMKLKT